MRSSRGAGISARVLRQLIHAKSGQVVVLITRVSTHRSIVTRYFRKF